MKWVCQENILYYRVICKIKITDDGSLYPQSFQLQTPNTPLLVNYP